MELADGWAIKTVYKSTLAHHQCPIAGAGVGVNCCRWVCGQPSMEL